MLNTQFKGQVAIIALDRAEKKVYPQICRFNVSMTLTASNRYLWVISLGEGTGNTTPLTFNRLITFFERGRLQGFPDIITKAAIAANVNCVQLFGNSMSVPMIGLMICLAWSGYREF